MPEGKIKKVLSEKGFGFIEGELGDLFFHHSEVQERALRSFRSIGSANCLGLAV